MSHNHHRNTTPDCSVLRAPKISHMGIMWAGLIMALDPNVGVGGGGDVAGSRWPRFSREKRDRMVFDEQCRFAERDANAARQEAIEYINSIQHAVFERQLPT